MAKLQLQPNPTFKARVEIPVPGASPVKVEFVFKHRTRDEMDKFLKSLDGMDDVEMIQKIAAGWELVDDFNEENIRTLVQGYIAAPREIFEAYLAAMTGARQKN
jgi:GMP synthase PP-ATPase subunit